MSFDLIIRGGNLYDGTAAEPFQADIGISGEHIAAIGDLSRATASAEINADNLAVAPGFIDAHAHSDAYLLLEPDAPSKISQGITTEVNGQCGSSGAPLTGAARLSSDWASYAYPRLSGERLEPAIVPGHTWTSLASYRQLFDSVRPALNTVQLAGHNTLRAGVMGYAPRTATPDELRDMCRLLEQTLDEGACGLSTGLLYQPGKYAALSEIQTLARLTAARGGFYASHIRSEGNSLLESIGEVLDLARETGVQVQISHLKTSGITNWHKLEAALELIEAAREEGLCVNADRYPYTASGTDLDIVLPEWAAAGGRDVILANLRDPVTRQRIVSELDASGRDWRAVTLGGGWSDTSRAFSGQSVAAAAASLQLTPGECVCRFIDADDTRTGAFFFGMSTENLEKIYARPWVMLGSDASLRAPWGPLAKDHPHPRAYGSAPRFLRLMAGRLEGGRPITGLAEAIRRLTSLPATTFGLAQRGVLRKGAFADIVVFDIENFTDKATYAAPHQFATGMRHVIVNGALSYSEGRFTGRRRGRFLERGHAG